METAWYSNFPEAASAAALAGLVPPVYGAFDVDIRDLHLHCFVTMAVDKTVDDQMEEWKREPLTPGLALRTIQLICRIILFMVYVAREMKAECHDWHIRHLGMQGERLYLINWVGTTISPNMVVPTQRRRYSQVDISFSRRASSRSTLPKQLKSLPNKRFGKRKSNA